MSSHVFGPVPSRRLGRSLGIDLVPFKVCTFDCIYCQLGHTTTRTLERKEWVPYDAVKEEVFRKLNASHGIDFLTFSGSGEPTLHTGIGKLIRALKKRSSVPVAVLTNGSLLGQEGVREDLLEADLVIPSLDAPNPHLFRHVNRPHPNLVFEEILEGLARFRETYRGKIWIEVFLLAGFTGMESEVKKISGLIRPLLPDRVQLMTVTRPPQEEFARSVSFQRMERFVSLFECPAEVVPASADLSTDARFPVTRNRILELLERRPCTVRDISLALAIPPAEAGKYLEDLFSHGQIKPLTCEKEIYYKADPH